MAEVELTDLLINLDGLGTDEIAARGKQLYFQIYLKHGHFGLHLTHDGQIVVFHERQYEHAFSTTSDRYSHPERKDLIDATRVARIRWIGAVIAGGIHGSACFERPSPTGRERPPNRLYVAFAECYVVWLEPRQTGGWRFSTAYVATPELIQKYQRGGRTVCRWG